MEREEGVAEGETVVCHDVGGVILEELSKNLSSEYRLDEEKT